MGEVSCVDSSVTSYFSKLDLNFRAVIYNCFYLMLSLFLETTGSLLFKMFIHIEIQLFDLNYIPSIEEIV